MANALPFTIRSSTTESSVSLDASGNWTGHVRVNRVKTQLSLRRGAERDALRTLAVVDPGQRVLRSLRLIRELLIKELSLRRGIVKTIAAQPSRHRCFWICKTRTGGVIHDAHGLPCGIGLQRGRIVARLALVAAPLAHRLLRTVHILWSVLPCGSHAPKLPGRTYRDRVHVWLHAALFHVPKHRS